MSELSIYQGDREHRAGTVRETYSIEYAGNLAWVVMHPDEEKRCYLVDLIKRSCSCPDWWGFCQGKDIDCKHILAVYPLWERLTGLKWEKRASLEVPEGCTLYRIERRDGRDVVIDLTEDYKPKNNLGWIGSVDEDDPFKY